MVVLLLGSTATHLNMSSIYLYYKKAIGLSSPPARPFQARGNPGVVRTVRVSRMIIASYPERVAAQEGASFPMAKVAVAYASAVPRSGPVMVTERTPVGGPPVRGLKIWSPRS